MNLSVGSQHRRRRSQDLATSHHSVRSTISRSDRSSRSELSPFAESPRKTERLFALGESAADLLSFSRFIGEEEDDDDDFSGFHHSPPRRSPNNSGSSLLSNPRGKLFNLPLTYNSIEDMRNTRPDQSEIASELLCLPEEPQGKCSPLAQRTSASTDAFQKKKPPATDELMKKVSNPAVYRKKPLRSSSDDGLRPSSTASQRKAPLRSISCEITSPASSQRRRALQSTRNSLRPDVVTSSTITSSRTNLRPEDKVPATVITASSPTLRSTATTSPVRRSQSTPPIVTTTSSRSSSRSRGPATSSRSSSRCRGPATSSRSSSRSRTSDLRNQSSRSTTPVRKTLAPTCSFSSSGSGTTTTSITQHNLHWDRQRIEVMPGYFLPLCGSQESIAAYHLNAVLETQCVDCRTFLFCIDTACMVLCPQCRTFSPVSGSEQYLGLGLTIDLLAEELQS